jgi:putative acetyltransferase
VNRAAFFEDPRVPELVETLRKNGRYIISLVAEIDGHVVGHVLFTRASLGPQNGEVKALGLSPLAVSPGYQGQGVGSALVRAGLDACREAGYECVFLLGAPRYYSRFGFTPARNFGVHYQNDRDPFQAVELVPGALNGVDAQIDFGREFAELG